MSIGQITPLRVRRSLFLVKIALLAAILLTSISTDAFAAGSISGRVTRASDGAGLAGTVVQFYDLNANAEPPSTTTDATGNYSINLPAGSYGVLTQDNHGYINKIWNNLSCSALCDLDALTPVVVANSAVTGINFVLDPGGRITGRVTRASDGAGIANVRVFFANSGPGENFPFSFATTDVDGFYTSEGGTATGNIYVATINNQGYRDEVYTNGAGNPYCLNCDVQAIGGLVPVTLASGASNINFVLDQGGQISGTVTNSAAAPLPNVEIRVWDSTTGDDVTETLTDALGHYATAGLPAGTYYAGTHRTAGYVDKLFGNVICINGLCDQTQGTLITVTAGANTSGRDIVLSPGGTITGTVTNAIGGAPISDVFVFFNTLSTSGPQAGQLVFVGGSFPGSDGFYTAVVPPGSYFAAITDPTFGNQVYNGVPCLTNACNVGTGTSIIVANAGVTIENINFALTAGTGSISGTVTNAAGGGTLQGIPVQLFSLTGTLISSQTTPAAGTYQFTGVPVGSYYVRAFSTNNFVGQIYNGATCIGSCTIPGPGTPVVVTAGGSAANINFSLTGGKFFSGVVTSSATGTLLVGIPVQLFNSFGDSLGSFNTNASGLYATPALPPGNYYVRTSVPVTQNFVDEAYNDHPCIPACVVTTGEPVTITAAAGTSGISFALAGGGSISGTVTNNGAAVFSMQIFVADVNGTIVKNTTTDASGNYTVAGLPTGTYFVRTNPNSLFQNYVTQLYNGQAFTGDITAGTPVDVTVGATHAGVNFAVVSGGTISGSVKATGSNAPIQGVGVVVYSSTGKFVKNGTTDWQGNYSVTGLAAGNYSLSTNAPASVLGGPAYIDEVYDNLPCLGCVASIIPNAAVTTGTPVAVTNGATHSGVNFVLDSGAGAIFGVVTNAVTGAVLPNVQVSIYNAAGNVVKSVLSGPNNGIYNVRGLTPGTYYARTFVSGAARNYLNEAYNNIACVACTITTTTPIIVTAAIPPTAANFALAFRTLGDGTGDGKTDVAIFRPSTGIWYIRDSATAGLISFAWGQNNDVPVAGDFDGDGRTDIAVFRSTGGVWFVRNSSTGNLTVFPWGQNGDVPVPADYDGDGKTDVAIFRPASGTWYVRNSSTGTLSAFAWGQNGDVAVAGDYDGDGKADVGVFRPASGTWYVRNSSTGGLSAFSWGQNGDLPVAGDYDGDGKTDVAVFRAATGTWYVRNSSTGSLSAFSWGQAGDTPVGGDYDGDGKADVAIFRDATGTWYVRNSSTGSLSAFSWGQAGDIPILQRP